MTAEEKLVAIEKVIEQFYKEEECYYDCYNNAVKIHWYRKAVPKDG